MVDPGAILASILAKGFGIELKFIDKSTGKTKTSNKVKNSVESGFKVETKGKNNTVNIYLNGNKLAPESQPLIDELSKSYAAKKINYLVQPAKEKLTHFREYENRINRNKVILTLSGIIPDRHIALVKTGLYIKMLGEDDKQDEVNKVYAGLENYSIEERNIVNLASAGHYTHYILPTFNELKGLNDGLNSFLEHYYKIINGGELALFVHRTMNSAEIVDAVVDMARRNIKYGVVRHKIYVHATGLGNVDVLESALKDVKKLFPQTQKKRLARSMPNLTLKIQYQINRLDEPEQAD